jgi:hypothetical protein
LHSLRDKNRKNRRLKLFAIKVKIVRFFSFELEWVERLIFFIAEVIGFFDVCKNILHESCGNKCLWKA